MCQSFSVVTGSPDGNMVCETIGDARRLFPVLVRDPVYAVDCQLEDESCLCPVDVLATAALHGYKSIEFDPVWGHVLERV